MSSVKVRIIKTHPAIEEAFPLGSEATVITKYYTERTLLAEERTAWDKEKQERYVYTEAVYAEVGDIKGHNIINFQGVAYSGDIFSNVFGPNNGSWANVFEKI